jgi:hypothetical protein
MLFTGSRQRNSGTDVKIMPIVLGPTHEKSRVRIPHPAMINLVRQNLMLLVPQLGSCR